MVEFTMTWKSERGNTCTDTGRASAEQIREWNAKIRQAVESGDELAEIKVPTDNDSDWSDGTIRAILVEEIRPLVNRPEEWS